MLIPLQHLAMSGNQQVNDIFAERMNANERKVENFSTGEDTVVDMQRPTTQGRNPLYDVCKRQSLIHCLKQRLQIPMAQRLDGS